MEKKRILLTISLMIFFMGCLYFINIKYDPLSRYKYKTASNRDIIINNLSKDEIDYIIDYDLKPEQFLPFMEINNFRLENSQLYYQLNSSIYNENQVVNVVNRYVDKYSIKELINYCRNYSLDNLNLWFDTLYLDDLQSNLISNVDPFAISLPKNGSLGNYEPNDIVKVDVLKNKKSDIYLQRKAYDALMVMLAKTNVNLDKLSSVEGYISYSKQKELYYGSLSAIMMGHNIAQLGNTFSFSSSDDLTIDIDKWLFEHAKGFGFYYHGIVDGAHKLTFVNFQIIDNKQQERSDN
ncbi:MAG: hypothetical protein WBO70_05040 [Erysipelotrichaceae bacterium]